MAKKGEGSKPLLFDVSAVSSEDDSLVNERMLLLLPTEGVLVSLVFLGGYASHR